MEAASKAKRSTLRGHDWINERSRALHQVVAERIRRDPKLMATAHETLARWMRKAGGDVLPALKDWRVMIESTPTERLLQFLVEESERADQLRQSSPFTGVLTQAERNEIFARYEAL